MQAKHGDEVATSISKTMDFPEASHTQSLANSLHEFFEYKKCLQWFNEVENEHKDLLRQQRFDFVVKCFKEFDMVNAKKIEAIKWDWNPLCVLLVMTNVYLQHRGLNSPSHILPRRLK
jgi:hypothetical protein